MQPLKTLQRVGMKLSHSAIIALMTWLVTGPWLFAAEQTKIKALASTFPIYQITRNVARDSSTLTVDLLLSPQLGCPHDYMLTPDDMQRLASADVLVINGLGLEEFLGFSLTRANPNLTIIESAAGITNLLRYSVGSHEDRHHHAGDSQPPAQHGAVNPHLFASPAMAARLAVNIAKGLAEADPANAALYNRNAEAYAGRLLVLAQEFTTLSRQLLNNRIVTQHDVFDYLARDASLRLVAVIQAHPGQDPSAAELLALIKTIKTENAGAVFTEPQYTAKLALLIARETGIPTATLDPVATGPTDAPLDYYELVMRANLKVLRQILAP